MLIIVAIIIHNVESGMNIGSARKTHIRETVSGEIFTREDLTPTQRLNIDDIMPAWYLIHI